MLKSLHQIAYLTIITHFEFKLRSNGESVVPKLPERNYMGAFTEEENNKLMIYIPPIIAKVYKGMTYDKYYNVKNDINWLSQKMRVCEECYLSITRTYL